MKLSELTEQNINTLAADEILALHRGVHRAARASDDASFLGATHALLVTAMHAKSLNHNSPLMFAAPVQSGLYLKSPHGILIYDGKKTAIAQAKLDDAIPGEHVICSKEDGVGLAFGVANVGQPLEVSHDVFNDSFDVHRVTTAECEKWWADCENLYLYPITSFHPYADPRPIEIEPGVQLVMDVVKFIETSEQKEVVEEQDMPWTAGDAYSHTHEADTDKKKEQWAAVANSALARCLKDGGDKGECEASAIRQANSVVAKKKDDSEPTQADLLSQDIVQEDKGTASDNNLPDSAFLYVEPGDKDSEGKTVPRKKRHLPYKTESGSLDLPRLRNALSRLGQPATGTGEDSWLTDSLRKTLRAKAERILKGAKKEIDDAFDELIKATEPDQSTCTCPNCGAEVDHTPGEPCNEVECPDCGSAMRGGGPEEDKAATCAKPDEDEDNADEKKPKPKDEEEKVIKPDILTRVKDVITRLLGHKDEPAGPFVLLDHKDGTPSPYFMLWTTNSYRDREGEIFTIQSIRDYVERKSTEPVKGEFWYAHVPGTKFGTVRWQAVVADRFLVQVGTFDDTPTGSAFKTFFTQYPRSHPKIAPAGWGASHGYNYIAEDRQDAVYDWFNTIESSVLPMHRAANIYNPCPTILGGKQVDNEKNMEELRAIGDELGTDLVSMIEQIAQQRKSELDDKVEHKSTEVDEAKQVPEKQVVDESTSTESGSSTEKAQEKQVPVVLSEDQITAVLVKAAEVFELTSLSETIAQFSAKIDTLEKQQDEIKSQIATLAEADEKKIANEVARLPNFGGFSWLNRASQASQTVLTSDDTELQQKAAQGHAPAALTRLAQSMDK